MAHDPSGAEAAVLGAVWVLIGRGGVEAVTFRGVARQAGVSLGKVQRLFGTREALVRASCAALIAGASGIYETMPGEALDRLRFILTHSLPGTAGARFGAVVWFGYLAKSVDDPQIAELLAATKRGTEDECVRLLRDASAAGVVAPVGDPRGVARRLLAIADGLTVRVLVGDVDAAEAEDLIAAELTALAP